MYNPHRRPWETKMEAVKTGIVLQLSTRRRRKNRDISRGALIIARQEISKYLAFLQPLLGIAGAKPSQAHRGSTSEGSQETFVAISIG